MCQNSAIESQKLHAVDAILDELDLKKKRLYCGLLLACERPTSHQSISPIPHSKGYGFSIILRGGYIRHLRAFCGLKCVLATRDVCKRPRRLHHWNQHSISDPVIPHIALYNAYRFVTKRINTSTVFVHVSDRVIGTGQTANTSCRKSTGNFSRYIACKHKNNHKNAKKTFFLFI